MFIELRNGYIHRHIVQGTKNRQSHFSFATTHKKKLDDYKVMQSKQLNLKNERTANLLLRCF